MASSQALLSITTLQQQNHTSQMNSTFSQFQKFNINEMIKSKIKSNQENMSNLLHFCKESPIGSLDLRFERKIGTLIGCHEN